MVSVSSTPAHINTHRLPHQRGVPNTAVSPTAPNAPRSPPPSKPAATGASTGSSTPTIPPSLSNKSHVQPRSQPKAVAYAPTMPSTRRPQVQVQSLLGRVQPARLALHLQQLRARVRARAWVQRSVLAQPPPVLQVAERGPPPCVTHSVVGLDGRVLQL